MKNNLLPIERIESKIYLIRAKKVIFDRDLAELYGVETKGLNRAVRRQKDRFPVDFMFQMNEKELEIWKYQFGTSNRDKDGVAQKTPCFYRTRCCYAFQRAKQQTSNLGQYPDNANIYQNSWNAGDQ